MHVFARITKVDEAKRQVWGRAVQEIPDNSNEIFDYVTSKPHFEKWSAEFQKNTNGKSFGNIRAMHGAVAAGKAIDIIFQDKDLAIDIGTEIVDDNEWKKCVSGVYTGFSIGGRYVSKWKDGDLTRYTAKPSEISLVDKPCVPTANFYEVIKMDGTVVKAEFKPQTPEDAVDTLADLLTKGTISPQRLVELAAAELKAKDPKKYDSGDGDLERPEEIDPDEWEGMDEGEQREAIQDAGLDIEDADTSATGPDGVKKTDAEVTAAHNVIVEKVARQLAKAEFEKLPEMERAGRDPEGQWQNHVPPATRAVARKVARNAAKAAKAAKADEAGKDNKKDEKPAAAKEDKPAADAKDKKDDKPAETDEEKKKREEAEAAAAKAATPTQLKKGLYEVRDFASVLLTLSSICMGAQAEASWEGDKSPIPAKLQSWMKTGAELFMSMAAEECAELMASLTAGSKSSTLAMSEMADLRKILDDPDFSMAKVDDLAKAHLSTDELSKLNGNAAKFAALVHKYGARNSTSDMALLQQAHDCLTKCGAACGAADKVDSGSLLKSSIITGLQKEVTELRTVGTSLAERLQKLEAQPLPSKGVLRSFTKGDEVTKGDVVNETADDKVIKAAVPGEHNPAAAEALIKVELRKHGTRPT